MDYVVQIIISSLSLGSFYALGALGLRFGWWIPTAAPAIALVASLGITASWSSSREREQRAKLMKIFSRYVSPHIAEYVWLHREEFFTPFSWD